MQSDDGAIFILPALPDVWKDGSIKGLRARGGFEIEDMEWKDGEITKLVIKSELGGNCRIRSYNKIKADGNFTLKSAAGENENLFFETPSIKKPLISEKAKLNKVNIKDTFLYDFNTKPGKVYVILGA